MEDQEMIRARLSRVLTRYTLASILKVGLATALLASLILMGVDLFANLDTYMNSNVSFTRALSLTLLYFPEAFLLALGPAFLFAVTYHLSMLHANNEIMGILNSGISIGRVIRPIIICAVLLSVFHFTFNEKVAIPSSNRKEVLTAEINNTSGTLSNNRNIALSDMQSDYMVYANNYSDRDQTLYNVSLLESTADGKLVRRTNAYRAVYDNGTGLWTFRDVYVYEPVKLESGASEISVQHYDTQVNTVLLLEPQLFRSGSNEISKMSLELARAYLSRMKTLNPDEYASLGTEYYKRIFSCLSPLIMMLIACSMNYRFKKNVLFLSLIISISLVVVYFVVQMMTTMMADQGVIAPQLGTLIPFAVMVLISGLLWAFLRRQ